MNDIQNVSNIIRFKIILFSAPIGTKKEAITAINVIIINYARNNMDIWCLMPYNDDFTSACAPTIFIFIFCM